MTALTVYGNTAASSTLSTAASMASVAGGASSSKDTKLGTATGYSELFGLGTAGAWSGAGSIGAVSGNGWLWDVTTLEGQQIISGNWTPTLRLQIAGGGTPSVTASLYVIAYVRSSGGSYTQIGSTMQLLAQTLNGTTTNYTFSATSLPLQSFNVGDRLYFATWANVTANTGTSSANVIRVFESNTASTGAANLFQIVTPGYQIQSVSKPFYGMNKGVGRIQ